MGTRPCQRPATFAPGTLSPFVWPYFALGRDRATFALGPGPLALLFLCAGLSICHSYASARVSDPNTYLESSLLSTLGARSPWAHLGREALALPLRLGAHLAGHPARAGLEPAHSLLLTPFLGARDVSVTRPTLAPRVLSSRRCLARVGPDALCV